MVSVSVTRPDPLIFAVFVPEDGMTTVVKGEGEVYEDDGESKAYKVDMGERLHLACEGDWADSVRVVITPSASDGVDTRGYALQLRGLQQSDRPLIGVQVDSLALPQLPDTAEPVDSRLEAVGWWTPQPERSCGERGCQSRAAAARPSG